MNLLSKTLLPSIAIFLFAIGCTKEQEVAPNFSEIIVGEWELTELVEPAQFFDTLWHEEPSPELNRICFQRDSIVIFKFILIDELGTYYVNEADNEISFFTNHNFSWRILDYTETEFSVSLGVGREGPMKRRYGKVE